MKRSYMKKLKPCYGKATMFYKEKIKDCPGCQFKQKCLLEIKGVREDD